MRRCDFVSIVSAAVTFVAAWSLTPVTADGQATADATAAAKSGPFPWQVTVYDRQGNIVRTVGALADESFPPAFSPDGARVAVVQALPGATGTDVSIFDLSTNASTRVMTGPAPRNPVWSPDGSQIAYFSFRQRSGALYRKAASGTGTEELLYRFPPGISDVHLTDWSPDGRFLVFDVSAVVWILPLAGDRKAVELLREDFQVFGARFSPDSRFLAYVSDESGRNEVYVRAFDRSSRRFSGAGRRVSGQGGEGMVHWRGDGRELYYLAPDDGVMALDVTATPFTTGSPRLLFRAPHTIPLEGKPDDDRYGRISRDGQRVAFAVSRPPERKLITVAPATLGQYTGRYVNPGGNKLMVITLEGGQLMVRGATETGPLLAESEASFFRRHPDRDADVEFVKDDKGVVTHFVESHIPAIGASYSLGPTTWTRTETQAKPKGGPFLRQLTVYDRQGQVVRTVGQPGHYAQPVLSPDGTRLAVIAMADPALGLARTGDRDAGLEFPTSSVLWVFDLSTGARTQVASGPDLATPAWSPDGSQIAYYFNSYRGYRGLYRKASNGTGREQLLYRFTTLGAYMCIADWSTDGRFVVFQSGGVLHALPLTGDRHVVELMREEESRVRRARLSPDSRFLAYTLLEEPDRSEIYVRAFDPVSGRLSSGGGPWQVSNQGGLGAVQWKSDGKELFYLAADGGVMAVDVAPTPVFTAGPPRLLLRAPGLVAQVDVCNYGADLSRDAQQVVSTVPMPTERKAITIAPAILARYTGRYVGRPDADPGDAVLTLEGNQLMYQCCFSGEPPTGARKFPLFAESDTYFFRRVPGGDFDHEFFKDDNGVVTHYLLHQGGSSGLKRTRR